VFYLKLLITLGLLFFSATGLTKASEQFQTRINVTYQFNQDGSSLVTQTYALTNLTSQTTASAYEFDILGNIPENLKAHDTHGEIDLKIVNHQSDLTRVVIPFNQLSAGKGKTYNFYLTYAGPKITKVDGLWKIILPNTSSSQPGQETTIRLIVPDKFGNPLTLYPTTSTVTRRDGTMIYDFPSSTGDITSGIYAIFGDFTLLGFELTYSPVHRSDSLEIPNDKPGQLVFIQNIEPHPKNITAAESGSWLMSYDQPVSKSIVHGYLLVEASSSAIFPQTGSLSLTNMTSLPEAKPGIPQILWEKPIQILPFAAFPSRLIISNPGSQAIYHLQIMIQSPDLVIDNTKPELIPVIPPLGQIYLPVKIFSDKLPHAGFHSVSVNAGISQVTYNVDARYFFLWYALLIIIGIIAFTALGGLTHYAWGLYFQKLKKRGNLRR
jgi:hypothetical protein